jgi:uracil-DNA glycosylase family 4
MGIAKAQHFTAQERQRGRVALAQRISAGDGKHPIGYGELELKAILDGLCEDYTHHFALPGSSYTFDFGLPQYKILIEVRGPGFLNRDSRARARVKDELAAEGGYLVVNFWWEQIVHQPQMVESVLLRLLKNHRGEYVYVDAVVDSVTHRKTRRDFPLYNIGVEGDESYVVSGIVSHNCRPPGNRDPRPEEIAACAGYLERQMALLEPKLIATLGRYSMEKFFPGARITRVHGQAKRDGRRVLIPLYHPAYILRNMAAMPDAVRDMQKIPRLLERLEQVLREEAAAGQPPSEPEPPADEPAQLSLF